MTHHAEIFFILNFVKNKQIILEIFSYFLIQTLDLKIWFYKVLSKTNY